MCTFYYFFTAPRTEKIRNKFQALVQRQKILHIQCQRPKVYLYSPINNAKKMKFESFHGDSYFSTANNARSDRSGGLPRDSVMMVSLEILYPTVGDATFL